MATVHGGTAKISDGKFGLSLVPNSNKSVLSHKQQLPAGPRLLQRMASTLNRPLLIWQYSIQPCLTAVAHNIYVHIYICFLFLNVFNVLKARKFKTC